MSTARRELEQESPPDINKHGTPAYKIVAIGTLLKSIATIMEQFPVI